MPVKMLNIKLNTEQAICIKKNKSEVFRKWNIIYENICEYKVCKI